MMMVRFDRTAVYETPPEEVVPAIIRCGTLVSRVHSATVRYKHRPARSRPLWILIVGYVFVIRSERPILRPKPASRANAMARERLLIPSLLRIMET